MYLYSNNLQDVAHFQQRIAITKSKPQSQPSDGREDYNKPVDEDGLKITMESYVCDHPPSAKVKQTYDHSQDVSEPGPPLRPPKQTIGAIEIARKLPSPTAVCNCSVCVYYSRFTVINGFLMISYVDQNLFTA